MENGNYIFIFIKFSSFIKPIEKVAIFRTEKHIELLYDKNAIENHEKTKERKHEMDIKFTVVDTYNDINVKVLEQMSVVRECQTDRPQSETQRNGNGRERKREECEFRCYYGDGRRKKNRELL